MPTITFPTPGGLPSLIPVAGGLQFRDVAPMICNVVDNGVLPDDSRVMVRLNEATKIILDYMIPVGGMLTANVVAVGGLLFLPPQMENAIEAHVLDESARVFGSDDIRQGWYEITNNSVFLDPGQSYDNPLIDKGLIPADEEGLLRRVYEYPGLAPDTDTVVSVTGAKRYVPVTNEQDYLIVQNIEAIKMVIISIERNENAAPDEAVKYRQQAFELLQAEVKKHIFDPRNYMVRKAAYHADLVTFPRDTLGWVRAQIALDLDQAMKTGKSDLTWSINQAERRIMQRGIYKDCIIDIQADVTGGMVYFPLNVQSVLAVDLNGNPIPIRSRFFEHLDNGPGMFSSSQTLKDMGDEYLPGTRTMRRKYKLLASCTNGQCLSAVCKLRWIEKKPHDLMTIKNYEAIRLMMSAKFLEEKQDIQNSQANQQIAFDILEKELRDYLGGIKHTVQIQTYGFGLGDVGNYWSR